MLTFGRGVCSDGVGPKVHITINLVNWQYKHEIYQSLEHKKVGDKDKYDVYVFE